MKVNLILSEDIPSFEKHCRSLTAFLANHGISPSDTTAYLITARSDWEADSHPDTCNIPAETIEILQMQSYRPEAILEHLTNDVHAQDTLTLLPGSNFGDALAVRLASRLGGTSMTDISSMKVAEETHAIQVERKVYSGHMLGTFRLEKQPFVLSLDANYEESEEKIDSQHLRVHTIEDSNPPRNRVLSEAVPATGLTEACFVIACGRGLRGKDNAKSLLSIAEEMHAAVGGTRPVVMSGWLPMDQLIGVSKNMIHPEVCLVLAASGSPAFYSGIEKSKCIIAVNQDERAPIFQKSDVCIVSDWKTFLPALLAAYKNRH